jgi:hypothetical protein
MVLPLRFAPDAAPGKRATDELHELFRAALFGLPAPAQHYPCPFLALERQGPLTSTSGAPFCELRAITCVFAPIDRPGDNRVVTQHLGTDWNQDRQDRSRSRLEAPFSD